MSTETVRTVNHNYARSRSLLEYFDTFVIRNHSGAGKFERSIFVMMVRVMIFPYQTTLWLRQRAGLFCTLGEAVNSSKYEETSRQEMNDMWFDADLLSDDV